MNPSTGKSNRYFDLVMTDRLYTVIKKRVSELPVYKSNKIIKKIILKY